MVVLHKGFQVLPFFCVDKYLDLCHDHPFIGHLVEALYVIDSASIFFYQKDLHLLSDGDWLDFVVSEPDVRIMLNELTEMSINFRNGLLPPIIFEG